MRQEIKKDHTVFAHATGIYKAYTIDRAAGKIGGYLLFPGNGQGNPYREFYITECTIKEI